MESKTVDDRRLIVENVCIGFDTGLFGFLCIRVVMLWSDKMSHLGLIKNVPHLQ